MHSAYIRFTAYGCARDTVATIRMRLRQEGRLSGTYTILTDEGSLSDFEFDPLRLEEIGQCERRSRDGTERTEDYESSFVSQEVRGAEEMCVGGSRPIDLSYGRRGSSAVCRWQGATNERDL